MRVVNLASGSKGNSTYIGHGIDNLLVDIGLSCLELEKRLKLINVKPECITAILLTHNHIDHIKGVVRFANKYNILSVSDVVPVVRKKRRNYSKDK